MEIPFKEILPLTWEPPNSEMNHLFRVRSWNNGVRRISFYILSVWLRIANEVYQGSKLGPYPLDLFISDCIRANQIIHPCEQNKTISTTAVSIWTYRLWDKNN